MTGPDRAARLAARAGPFSGLRPSTVRGRLVWTTAAIMIAAMVVMSLVVLIIVTRTSERHVDTTLKQHVTAAASALHRTDGGHLRVARRPDDDLIDSVWIFDRHGQLVSGPTSESNLDRVVRGLRSVSAPTRIDRRQRAYYARPVHLGDDARPAAVIVSTLDLDPYNDSRDRLVTGLIVLSVMVTILTAAFSAWTVRRALKPVDKMTSLADLWSDHDLETRFGLADDGDELSRLGATLDRLLDRVGAALRNERQLTSELAHELRTPLTTIRAEAELGMMAASGPDARRRLERIIAQTDRLTGTIATLLAIARSQRQTASGCDVETVLLGLVQAHSEPIPITLTVDPDATGCRAAAGANLLERAIAPLLDNAVRYAATEVRVDVRSQDRQILIDIADDGPGIDADDPHVSGTGLGLKLARRVATSLGGDICAVHAEDPTIVRTTIPAQ